jgi:hypothetical protein
MNPTTMFSQSAMYRAGLPFAPLAAFAKAPAFAPRFGAPP